MVSNSETKGSFVQNWLASRIEAGELDVEILNLIRNNLQGINGEDLDESKLMKDLKNMVDNNKEENGA
jgi:hypothetical protein